MRYRQSLGQDRSCRRIRHGHTGLLAHVDEDYHELSVQKWRLLSAHPQKTLLLGRCGQVLQGNRSGLGYRAYFTLWRHSQQHACHNSVRIYPVAEFSAYFCADIIGFSPGWILEAVYFTGGRMEDFKASLRSRWAEGPGHQVQI